MEGGAGDSREEGGEVLNPTIQNSLYKWGEGGKDELFFHGYWDEATQQRIRRLLLTLDRDYGGRMLMYRLIMCCMIVINY